jgi:hypothetical protein
VGAVAPTSLKEKGMGLKKQSGILVQGEQAEISKERRLKEKSKKRGAFPACGSNRAMI